MTPDVEVTPRNAAVLNALQNVSRALRPVHGVLVDATRLEYEREHGTVANAGALLQLVLNDPAFVWLRPLSELMGRIDGLAESRTLDVSEVLLCRAAVESWAQGTRYLETLQHRSDLVLAHAQLHLALKQLEEAFVPVGRPLFGHGHRAEVGIA